MEEYSEGFIENGYDDLETVKLIEREDLIAIGVNRSDHQVYSGDEKMKSSLAYLRNTLKLSFRLD